MQNIPNRYVYLLKRVYAIGVWLATRYAQGYEPYDPE